jgi:acyl dehydratase
MKLTLGDTYKHDFRFSQDNVIAFAQLTGDDNPLHLDPDYAAQTPFKQPIIHGALSSSIFTKVLGTEFPGYGSVYLKQTTEFIRPMFVDTDYEATFTVISINEDKHIAEIQGEIVDKITKKKTIVGVATLMHKDKI